MKFSFGICTGGNSDNRINQIINSIEMQNIPEYEIIIIGESGVKRKNTNIIKFNENKKKKWITKKKNIITENAKFDNIVFLHDYIVLENEWYKNIKLTKFDICVTKVKNLNGERYRDWVIAPWCFNTQKYKENTGLTFEQNLLPYYADSKLFNNIMYISGSYWVAKKEVMEKIPLDENLRWGQGEDIEWSHRIRKHYYFTLNDAASVKIIMPGKKVQFSEMNNFEFQKLKTNMEKYNYNDKCEFC